MLTIDIMRSEKGPQRRLSESGRLLHCCCVCGRLDRWGKGWEYYGSYKDLEDGAPVAKFCSSDCRGKAGPNARNITNEAKARAKAAEWREPTIAYREMTEGEKYAAAREAQFRARSAITVKEIEG